MLQKDLLKISGRCRMTGDVLYLGYSASYVEVSFSGRTLEADIFSDGYPDEEHLRAYIAVFVDGEKIPSKRLECKKGKHTYLLYEDAFKKEQVTVRIMKYSEAAFASVGIEDIRTDGCFFKTGQESKPVIEFIGDSITCGYGVDAEHELIPFHTKEENPWEAYACRTAEKLGMEFELVSWSGNGIISHYVDPDVDEPRLERFLMPGLYDYTDRELDERLGFEETEIWNPSRKPEVIVINLGTNDCSYTREIPERNARFQEEYRKFVKHVRSKNPDALIVLLFGIMDTRLNGEIQNAAEMLQAEGDTRLYVLKAPLQLDEDGRGADFHPSKVTHEKVAELLSSFLMEKRSTER